MSRVGSLLPEGTCVHINSLGVELVPTARRIVVDGLETMRAHDGAMPGSTTFDGCILRFVGDGADAAVNGTAIPGMALGPDRAASASILLSTLLDMLDAEHVRGWPSHAIAWNGRRRSMIGGPALRERPEAGEILSTPWERGRTVWETENAHLGAMPDDDVVCGCRPVVVGLQLNHSGGMYLMGINHMIMGRIGDISTMDALRHLSAHRRRN